MLESGPKIRVIGFMAGCSHRGQGSWKFKVEDRGYGSGLR